MALYSFGAIPLAVSIYAAPIFLSKVMGMSQASLGRWLWLPPLGWEIGYFFWGWLLDRSGGVRQRLVVLLAVASGGTALVPFATGPAVALFLLVASMFVASGFVMSSLKYGLRSYPHDQALVAGLGAGAWSGLVALLMPWVGSMFDAGRYAGVFVVTAALPMVGAALWSALALPRKGSR